MATDPSTIIEDEPLELDVNDIIQPEEGAPTPETEEDAEETIVGFGEDGDGDDDQGGTDLVRHMRSEFKRVQAENRELRARLPVDKPIDAGPKPTLESLEWDEEKFEAALLAWNDRTRQAKDSQTEAQRQQEAIQEQWQAELASYNEKKVALKLPDFDDAETTVKASLDAMQQTVLIKACANPAAVVAALGKSPGRLTDIAKIKDPIKLAVALNNLERDVKVTTRKKPPAPESHVRGAAPLSTGNSDKRLAELEKEADRTGDRSKVIQYRREQRASAS